MLNSDRQLLVTIPHLSSQVFITLSMGMSDDLENAIRRAGSTIVRVGTAILVNDFSFIGQHT